MDRDRIYFVGGPKDGEFLSLLIHDFIRPEYLIHQQSEMEMNSYMNNIDNPIYPRMMVHKYTLKSYPNGERYYDYVSLEEL